MKTTNMFIIGLAVLFCWSGSLYADYTLFLKNGRSITVQRYREEGGKIIVYSPGVELTIAKDQIESIVRVEKGEGEVKEQKEKPVDIQEKAKTPEELLKERRAKEEKEYQKRVEKITGQIEAMNDRHNVAIGGSTNFRFKLISPEESRRLAWKMIQPSGGKDVDEGPRRPVEAVICCTTSGIEVIVRSKDYASGKLIKLRNQMFPRRKGEKGGKLAKLRNQMFQLTKERKKLIQEMKQENFDTGSLFLK